MADNEHSKIKLSREQTKKNWPRQKTSTRCVDGKEYFMDLFQKLSRQNLDGLKCN